MKEVIQVISLANLLDLFWKWLTQNNKTAKRPLNHPYTYHLIGEYDESTIKELDEYFEYFLEDDPLKKIERREQRINEEIFEGKLKRMESKIMNRYKEVENNKIKKYSVLLTDLEINKMKKELKTLNKTLKAMYGD